MNYTAENYPTGRNTLLLLPISNHYNLSLKPPTFSSVRNKKKTPEHFFG